MTGDTPIRPAQLDDEEKLFDLVRAFPTPTPPDAAAYAAALRSKLGRDRQKL